MIFDRAAKFYTITQYKHITTGDVIIQCGWTSHNMLSCSNSPDSILELTTNKHETRESFNDELKRRRTSINQFVELESFVTGNYMTAFMRRYLTEVFGDDVKHIWFNRRFNVINLSWYTQGLHKNPGIWDMYGKKMLRNRHRNGE